MLIVWVDDEECVRKMLKKYLQDVGVPFAIYGSAEEFFEHSDGMEQPFVLLADRTMPGMGGLELCRRVRKEMSAYIIMVSGHVEDEGCCQFCDSYLQKPFAWNVVLTTLEFALVEAETLRPPPPENSYQAG